MSKTLSKEGLEAWKGLLFAHAALVEKIDKAMAEQGLLPLDWYDVLLVLEMEPEQRLRMTELAQRVLLSKSGLTRLVDRIEAKGYLRRESCPGDRRVSYAAITPQGLKAREESWPAYREAIQESFASHLSDEEAKVIGSALMRFSGHQGDCGGG